MARIDGPEVKVGQIWRNWDVRLRDSPDAPYSFVIEEIHPHENYVLVKPTKRKPGEAFLRRIRLDRMRPTSHGYKLLKWEPRDSKLPVQKAVLTVADTVEVKDELSMKLCDNPDHHPSCTGDPSGVECESTDRPLADDETLVIEVGKT